MPPLDPSYINLEATAAALEVISDHSEGITAPSVDTRVNAFYDCEVPIAVFALVLQLATDGYVEAGPRQPDKYERFFLTEKGRKFLSECTVPLKKILREKGTKI